MNLLLLASKEKSLPPDETSSHPFSENAGKFFRRGQQPIRFAKLDGHVVAHSLVQGFPIENALRHLANDPNNHPSIRELAKVAVTGGKDGDGSNIPMALWALHDELHQHKHPAKDWYNWMSAADKIGLDAHTYRALKEHAQEQLSQMPGTEHGDEWHWSPESYAVTASHGLHFKDTTRLGTAERIKARVQSLSPMSKPEDIEESIRRHHWRAMKHWRQSNVGGTDPTTDAEEERIGRFDLAPYKEVSGRPEYMKAAEKATRYRRILRRLARRSGVEPSNTEGLRRYQMVAGDFLGALRRIRSSDQHAIRKTTEEIAAKLGLKPASTVDALHNSPAYSVPGVAQAIYANASPESVHAAAAWYGLTGNIPGMAVFHVRPDGPDMLHRFRMQGSGHDMLQKLDKAGIADRVLVPHRKGFDLLIPDRGGKMRDRVREFTQRQKTELQSSRGHFKLIGAADQARAREMFRNAITKQERGQTERPTMRSRIKRILIRMAKGKKGESGTAYRTGNDLPEGWITPTGKYIQNSRSFSHDDTAANHFGETDDPRQEAFDNGWMHVAHDRDETGSKFLAGFHPAGQWSSSQLDKLKDLAETWGFDEYHVESDGKSRSVRIGGEL